MNLKKRVRKMLLELEISMKDFAGQLGISSSYLSYILDDKRKAYMTRGRIEKIVKKFEAKNQ